MHDFEVALLEARFPGYIDDCREYMKGVFTDFRVAVDWCMHAKALNDNAIAIHTGSLSDVVPVHYGPALPPAMLSQRPRYAADFKYPVYRVDSTSDIFDDVSVAYAGGVAVDSVNVAADVDCARVPACGVEERGVEVVLTDERVGDVAQCATGAHDDSLVVAREYCYDAPLRDGVVDDSRSFRATFVLGTAGFSLRGVVVKVDDEDDDGDDGVGDGGCGDPHCVDLCGRSATEVSLVYREAYVDDVVSLERDRGMAVDLIVTGRMPCARLPCGRYHKGFMQHHCMHGLEEDQCEKLSCCVEFHSSEQTCWRCESLSLSDGDDESDDDSIGDGVVSSLSDNSGVARCTSPNWRHESYDGRDIDIYDGCGVSHRVIDFMGVDCGHGGFAATGVMVGAWDDDPCMVSYPCGRSVVRKVYDPALYLELCSDNWIRGLSDSYPSGYCWLQPFAISMRSSWAALHGPYISFTRLVCALTVCSSDLTRLVIDVRSGHTTCHVHRGDGMPLSLCVLLALGDHENRLRRRDRLVTLSLVGIMRIYRRYGSDICAMFNNDCEFRRTKAKLLVASASDDAFTLYKNVDSWFDAWEM